MVAADTAVQPLLIHKNMNGLYYYYYYYYY
jgi:hypothetical protein